MSIKTNWADRAVRLLLLALGLVLILGAAACGDDGENKDGPDAAATSPSASEQEPSIEPEEEGPQEVTFIATEFKFDIPEISAGKVEITLQNDGKQPHFLFLVPFLNDAPPIEEILKLSRKEQNEFIAGSPEESPVAEPGQQKTLEVNLKAGRYAALCFIKDPATKKEHAFLGMAEEFTIE